MITEARMDELAAQAIKLFPIPPRVIEICEMAGDRALMTPTVRRRVLWMLSQAFNEGEASTR